MLRARGGHGRRGWTWLRRGCDGHKGNRRVRSVQDDHLPRWPASGGGRAAIAGDAIATGPLGHISESVIVGDGEITALILVFGPLRISRLPSLTVTAHPEGVSHAHATRVWTVISSNQPDAPRGGVRWGGRPERC